MKKIGFDSQKYIQLQSARIRERIDSFGGKLYLHMTRKIARNTFEQAFLAKLSSLGISFSQSVSALA